MIREAANSLKENVLVYGDLEVAIDFANAMAFSKNYRVAGIISDTHTHQSSLSGLKVIRFEDVETEAPKLNCKMVVLAISRKSTAKHSEKLRNLDDMGLSVSYAPTMDRAFDYEVQLKAVSPEEVLGRTVQNLHDENVKLELCNQTILITGAGGSIGAELCRRLLRYGPEKLVVLEVNELALYTLEQELLSWANANDIKTNIVYVLGSVNDNHILTNIFDLHNITYLYHAAAYKHVPMLENNIAVGIVNNVFATRRLANFAHRHGVKKFVLISSDKAVRPTNIMGATKRLAEMIIKDFAQNSNTVFTMVRFGNVLGSSGSVIPKFKNQIKSGGPVTVTHPEITRYFMSIPEATHLVLSASALADGGEVFLLDMGEPVKIVELAKTMIRQHGLQPVLSENFIGSTRKNNELEIEFSGLRLGEKLYEELLIGNVCERTSNPQIYKSEDEVVDSEQLEIWIAELERHVEENDSEAIKKFLIKLPLGFSPTSRSMPVVAKERPIIDVEVHKFPDEISSDDQIQINSDVQRASLLKRVVSSKIGLALLHRYFWFTRGMTLGVRVVVSNEAGEILVVKHTYIQGWHLPGGGVEHGEDVQNAAIREVFEETGVTDLKDLRFLGFEFNSQVSKKDHIVFFAAKTSQVLRPTKSLEISSIEFQSLDQIKLNWKSEHDRLMEKYLNLATNT
jgi:FlaA1/EpsC-like NDP-sugar epimerase/8-oxo-dGTP pyrophosphatase MutT (NUDIX family)